MSSFVHLHLHSGFSLVDGACDQDKLAKTAAKYKMPAVAVTDHGNLFGAIGFYEAANKAGVKPIIGCEMYVAKTNRFDRDPANGRPHHLILLCENEKGYRNLVKLVSKGYLEGFYYKPRIDKELLSQHSEGLIGLSACLNGEVASNVLGGRVDQAERAAGEYLDIFGRDRFFLEIHNHGLEKQRKIIPDMLQISARTGIRPVATNDCHYMQQDDCRAHDILLCIQTGKTVNDPNRYARENDIPVGPGRGSAAGSLVSYCMRITDLDPLQYGLLFERFLNPERVTLPDIDIDFCMNRRAAVIDYVTKKYGRENVSQIITFGTMAT